MTHLLISPHKDNHIRFQFTIEKRTKVFVLGEIFGNSKEKRIFYYSIGRIFYFGENICFITSVMYILILLCIYRYTININTINNRNDSFCFFLFSSE